MIIFCALDAFDQQAGQRKSTIRGTDRFFGPIQPAEGQRDRFQVWGYRANLGYKIVVLTIAQPPVSESAVRGLCEKVKDGLFDRVLDPFYRPFSPLDSPALLAKVNKEADAIQQPQV
jgi:hypothetical protein